MEEAHRGLMRTVLKRISRVGDCVSTLLCVYIQYECVYESALARNSPCVLVCAWKSKRLCVCLVLVSTPHSLIKGRGKQLTGRLNLKG